MTERLHFHFSLSCIGEGNGNPLQCSCLENPRDGGAWWAAVYGVTQSRTRLKWLSSSSDTGCTISLLKKNLWWKFSNSVSVSNTFILILPLEVLQWKTFRNIGSSSFPLYETWENHVPALGLDKLMKERVPDSYFSFFPSELTTGSPFVLHIPN